MSFPRRRFLQWAASMTSLAVARNGRSSALRLLDGTGVPDLQPKFLPSQKDVWDQ